MRAEEGKSSSNPMFALLCCHGLLIRQPLVGATAAGKSVLGRDTVYAWLGYGIARPATDLILFFIQGF